MLIVNLLGLVLIGLIAWWFWIYQPSEVITDKGAITVIVENGTYQPSRIKLMAGQSATLQFLRKDASPCAEMVVFSDFDISEELSLNKPKSITLPAMQRGEYDFTCQMQMYRGKIIVE